MYASKPRTLVMIFVTSLLASLLTVWAQTSPLKDRIPKPDPKKYQAVRDAKDWQNPILIVRAEGIEVLVVTPPAHGIPAESVPDVLEHLPDSAWPYGLVVMVADTGVLGSRKEIPHINANRTKLLKILKGLGIAVELWPSA
jgi:hypothetical protein